jgi:hypothetical protein
MPKLHQFIPWTVALLMAALTTPGSSIANTNRSIRQWVSCDGKTDDRHGVAQAIDAAKNNAFTLVVDCPVFISVGSDVSRPIFIDNGTTVAFSSAGRFITDNAHIPAFVIANSAHIRLLDWKILYVGKLQIDTQFSGYTMDGQFIPQAGRSKPSSAFNDIVLTAWLAKNRSIKFSGTYSPWVGPTSTASLFYLVGSVRDVDIRGLHVFVPKDAPASRFVPMVFTSAVGFRDNQTATRDTPLNSDRFAVPSDLTFTDIDFDGTYMGWQGVYQDAVFKNIRSHRYADLQDDEGGNVGGVGKWFAPPHLFYLGSALTDNGLRNEHVRISNVIDFGVRAGTARDRDREHLSGYANSLKIGGHDIQVDHYTSHRPDGFADLTTCDKMTVTNVEATFDSSFINDLFPGLRFPAGPPGYRALTLKNIHLVDLAPISKHAPIDGNNLETNENVTFDNVSAEVTAWGGMVPLKSPEIRGRAIDAKVNYRIRNQ